MLDSQHVVIFGGSSGIGLAAAVQARSLGAELTLVGRNRAKLNQAADSLGGARVVVADITDRAEVEAVFAGLERVDHLVVTAGTFNAGRVADCDPDVLLHALDERIAGPLYAIKAALPLFSNRGSIILTGGQLSDRPTGNGVAVISAAVRGVEALAGALAQELKPIRVNVVAPGFTDTPLFDVLGETSKAFLQQVAESLPVGRVGQAEEIGAAILFMMTNTYINGEVLHIDGGGRLI
ncbi:MULTISPECIES: SDR family oxidoreductase [unclassified Duganella]|uniref:SDR family oxidoreductase n=1 Tax=unclassified Duganella TaxID=2636909 RepID=UPI0006F22423|nr:MULTISPECIES: SDR family oxidoreductase [unclassified Duganella]KQV44770.1 short-chain dehydrogenase [Duganella sp. Root336D2]KRB83291.1 short-chain dehydrogenase [Duganella sp. Root198D2]